LLIMKKDNRKIDRKIIKSCDFIIMMYLNGRAMLGSTYPSQHLDYSIVFCVLECVLFLAHIIKCV
jgi:hypothetical protein